ncbi:FxsA family protein [Paenibacillus radicis (ex Gao et al. 2016)]|uniref:Membrane protein FxsA n=1 Tax=Paenibacillus radicis (ex Gao et al. 2016) TaxID=1737354 RepID=A0A917HCW1_9BACL|nr:FxsA family protein [Paenibacillus radicis (ex Gao et al. 2016)]GGG74713.1 membrane protein FxsA [Paenibacillus radicis (ex Gao et al. 2016)]
MAKWIIIAAVILIPALEFWGIVQVGNQIGGWNTFFLILLISLLGAYLAQMEGRKVWFEAQRLMQEGQIPGLMLLDGLCVLAGGLLLFIPGFFSDIIGITLLLPLTRPWYRRLLLGWLEKRMRNGNFTIGRW